MTRLMLRRCVLLAIASVLALSGCLPVPVPPLGYSTHSRDNLPDRVPEFIVKGTTTREEVLLGLGAPDAQSPDGRWFAYRSERHTGGVVFVVGGGYSAGVAGGISGYEERMLIVRFDTRSIVTEATMEDRVCPRGFFGGGNSSGESSPCLKVPDLSSGRPPDVLAFRTFYVAKADADTRNINRLIEAELRRKGLEATTGPANETPKEIDAILTYEDITDANGRIDELTTRIQAPGSKSPFATASSRQGAPAAKAPEEMVAEAVAGLFAGPGRPFLTLPPYRSTPDSHWVASPLDKAPVRIDPVRDARATAGARSIGERTALGFWLGDIDVSPLPAEVIAQLLRAELATMGHRSIDAGADVVIDARVTRFDVRTPSTLIYWDVDGVITVDLGVTRREGARQEFHYEVTCTDRTYISLSETLIKGVVSTCLANLGAKVREDRALGEAMDPH